MSLGKSPALLPTAQFILYPTLCAIPISGNAYCCFLKYTDGQQTPSLQKNKQKSKTNITAMEWGSWQHKGCKSLCAQTAQKIVSNFSKPNQRHWEHHIRTKLATPLLAPRESHVGTIEIMGTNMHPKMPVCQRLCHAVIETVASGWSGVRTLVIKFLQSATIFGLHIL